MLLNELLQWAVLIFLVVMVTGLLRQLGDFLLPPQDRLPGPRAPSVGDRLPAGLVPDSARARLMNLFKQFEADRAVVVVVDEDCDACHALVADLRQEAASRTVPVVALTSTVGESYLRQLEGVVDLVEANPSAIQDAGLDVRPMLLVVDADLKVRKKTVGTLLADALDEPTPHLSEDRTSPNGQVPVEAADHMPPIHLQGGRS